MFTAIPGDDKLRLMSESARGEGGRVWTYKDGKPWYFLEERYNYVKFNSFQQNIKDMRCCRTS